MANDNLFERLEILGDAMSCSARLRMIQRLCEAEASVDELAQSASLSVANASQHLQRLHRAGWIVFKKRGRQRIYSLRSNQVARLWDEFLTTAEELDSEIKSEHPSSLQDLTAIASQVRSGQAILIDARPEKERARAPIPGSIPLDEYSIAAADLKKPHLLMCRGRYCKLAEQWLNEARERGAQADRIPSTPAGWKKAWDS